MTQTKPDIQVYVGYVRRHTKHLRMRHARTLNLCPKWIQKHHSGITFKHIADATLALYCIVDSAFRADEPDFLALGADVMSLAPHSGTHVGGLMHVLVITSKTQSRVNRNTFSAEAHALGDSGSAAIALAGMLHEVALGLLRRRGS